MLRSTSGGRNRTNDRRNDAQRAGQRARHRADRGRCRTGRDHQVADQHRRHRADHRASVKAHSAKWPGSPTASWTQTRNRELGDTGALLSDVIAKAKGLDPAELQKTDFITRHVRWHAAADLPLPVEVPDRRGPDRRASRSSSKSASISCAATSPCSTACTTRPRSRSATSTPIIAAGKAFADDYKRTASWSTLQATAAKPAARRQPGPDGRAGLPGCGAGARPAGEAGALPAAGAPDRHPAAAADPHRPERRHDADREPAGLDQPHHPGRGSRRWCCCSASPASRRRWRCRRRSPTPPTRC